MDIALGLAARGIASVRYDKRTLDYPQSIDPRTFTLTEEYVPDALAAIGLLKHEPLVDLTLQHANHEDFPIGANRPLVRRTRSDGASSSSKPRRPALTKIVPHPAALASTRVGKWRFWPIGLIPPTT